MLATKAAVASTIVRFETTLGDIDVRLFNSATPASVANFLNYVTDGDYDDSFIHRAPPNFVIQGGGFRFPAGSGVSSIPSEPPVMNEPLLTNIRGTLAYAKVGAQFDPDTNELIPGTGPDSATNGWFFSTVDNNNPSNPLSLDNQNGGFTVFGTVVRGLDIVDQIASETVISAGGALSQLPVLDSFDDNPLNDNGTRPIFREDLIFINTVSILNFAPGDYDFDGDVDVADFSAWRAEFGNTLSRAALGSTTPSADLSADGNGDAVVSAADFTLFRDTVGAVSAAAAPAVIAVPEPATIGGLAFLLLPAALRRRRVSGRA